MESSKFKKLISQVEELNDAQYRDLKGCIEQRGLKKRVSQLLDLNTEVKCPECGSNNHIKNGVRSDLQRYICKDCKKNFNILSGTPLARLRKKGRWIKYAECLSKGLSIRNTATIVEVDKKTSFRWRHRFLHNTANMKPNQLYGVAENTETSFKYSEKGRKVMLFPEKLGKDIFVFLSRDRARNSYDEIIEDFDLKSMKEKVQVKYPKDILFCSDNINLYKRFIKYKNIRHGKIDTKKGLFINKDVVHLNNSFDYKKQLHDWMYRFRGVATKYLKNYLGWFREMDEFLMDIPPEAIVLRANSLDNYSYQPLKPTL
jgi:transposase-like protein